MIIFLYVFFFFSSRRRHTRLTCDWSSDVCSSDLGARDALHTVALVLLGVTAFASLLDEIAWTRVLVMIVGGSTYAFTLVLVVFLLGIGLGSALVARRSTARAVTAASAGFAQGVTAAGAAALFVFF